MTPPVIASIASVAAAVLLMVHCRPRGARTLESRPCPSDPLGVVAAAPTWLLRLAPTGRGRPAPRAVGEWCDELARSVRSGTSLHDALATVVPTDDRAARSTDVVRLRLARGIPVSDAVTSVDASADVRLVLDVVRVAARLGGPPAAAIDRTGSTLRVRAADCEERAAHAAQARLSAHVLTAVPLAMLALMATLDPDVGHAVATPIGSLCILFGLGLNLAGWTWMRRIVTVTT